MNTLTRTLRDYFVSLQLTVALLVLSIVLVFVATLDQVNLGIWAVQEKYFRSFFVMGHVPGSAVTFPIFPGGYFIGGLLLLNLLAAHIHRFQLTWKKLGIQLAHSGVILLLIGELLTGLLQQDSMLRLDTGETKPYSESTRGMEFAILDTTNPAFDEVVAVPESVIAGKGIIQHGKLPFRVRIAGYYPNATVQGRDQGAGGAPSLATIGIGTQVSVVPLPLTYKQDERNLPAAYVEVLTTEGTLGTWLLSPMLGMPQTFTYQNRNFLLTLRSSRYYKPFTVQLLQFTHDKYPGTEIPKNFASRVRVKSDDAKTDREVLIFMNNPLRFGGYTFYQAGFENNDRTSILQVVRNPGWLIPYVSCIMMGLGLVIQFSFHLLGFIRKRGATASTATV